MNLGLLDAARQGRFRDVQRLLRAQDPHQPSAIDAVNDKQRTALMLAAFEGHEAVVQLLLAFGASVNARDAEDWTALMLAAVNDHEPVVQLLLEAGADVHAVEEDQYTALMLTAQNGHVRSVRRLIEHGADVDAAESDKWTVLMMAADNGYDRVARMLIDHDASVNAFSDDNYSALILASGEGYLTTVQLLLDAGASINAMRNRYRTALMQAAFNGHVDVVRLLLEHGASVETTDKDEWTPLMYAAYSGHHEIVALLIDCGAAVDAIDTKSSALTLAARKGHLQTVRELLDRSASIDATHYQDLYRTALMEASLFGREATVELLLARGASVDAVDVAQWTPLMLAAQEGNDRIVDLLLEHGASIDASEKDGLTALMVSIQYGHEHVMRLLIDRGASVDALDSYEWTPLMMAILYGYPAVARLMVERGAELDVNPVGYYTALIVAAEEGDAEALQCLIDHGASVNAVSKEKTSALMAAAQSGHEEIVRILISHGAGVDLRNNHGETALIIAASEGHKQVVRALIDAGASVDTMDKDGETAMTYAIANSRNDVVLELLHVKTTMNDVMELLKLGIQKRKSDEAERKKASAEAKVPDVKLSTLSYLSSEMGEAREMCERICSRLQKVELQLQTVNDLVARDATKAYQRLIDKTHGFLMKHVNVHLVTRLVGIQVVIDMCGELHRELDALLLRFNLSCVDEHLWKKQWEQDASAMRKLLSKSLKQKEAIMDGLQDRNTQTEALTLLLFECNHRKLKYTEEEMVLINDIFHFIASFSHLKIPSVPDWFVPPHEVEFDARSSIATGSYGSVHYGTWNGTEVAVKCAFLEDDKSHSMFMNETEIWFKLQHPHIVTLFRACHVGNPFFVCDYASNGTLGDYLFRTKNEMIWSKLHETALGLHYLHTKHKVVHGDMKCNNILISADGKVKLADFGLSFVFDEESISPTVHDEVGAMRWKAPEVLTGKTRGSFASDVYSFGMCIVEALSGRAPWGIMPDVAVKHKVVMQKELPKQPANANEKQWELVRKMCAWDPSERLDMGEVVALLMALADEELNLKIESEWKEVHGAEHGAAWFA